MGIIHEIKPVAQLLDEMVAEAEAATIRVADMF
jgi:hypothetical protein